MRLIHVKTKRLEEFIGDHVPTYAILSHTWGADHEELSFQEVQNGLPEKVSQGSRKLEGCCQEALKDSISYVWIDTCCIDKTNSTELGEAINSMFRWYQGAKVCYAYLSDVRRSKVASVPIKSLQKSRWFTRGWTLQELIAPMDLRFYDLEWGFLGTKRKLASAVSGITGIPRSLLLGITTLAEASVAQRMSWAARRTTKRKEDIAYCLLGIFDISMPMIYGEGHKAFLRLQEEILRHIRDDSILAWGWHYRHDLASEHPSTLTSGAFARGPENFAECGRIVVDEHISESMDAIQVIGGSLKLNRRITKSRATDAHAHAMLYCHEIDYPHDQIGVPIQPYSFGGQSNGYERVPNAPPHAFALPLMGAPQDILIRTAPDNCVLSTRQCSFFIDNRLELELALTEVYPTEWWDGETDMIVPTREGSRDSDEAFVRLQSIGQTAPDFLIILDLQFSDSQLSTNSDLMICSKGCELKDLSEKSGSFSRNMFGKRAASNGITSILVDTHLEQLGSSQMFIIKVDRTATIPHPTSNVSMELFQIDVGNTLLDSFREDHRYFLRHRRVREDLELRTNYIEIMKPNLQTLNEQIRALTEERDLLQDQLQATEVLVKELDSERDSIQSQRKKLSTLTVNTVSSIDELHQERLAKELIASWHTLFPLEEAASWDILFSLEEAETTRSAKELTSEVLQYDTNYKTDHLAFIFLTAHRPDGPAWWLTSLMLKETRSLPGSSHSQLMLLEETEDETNNETENESHHAASSDDQKGVSTDRLNRFYNDLDNIMGSFVPFNPYDIVAVEQTSIKQAFMSNSERTESQSGDLANHSDLALFNDRAPRPSTNPKHNTRRSANSNMATTNFLHAHQSISSPQLPPNPFANQPVPLQNSFRAEFSQYGVSRFRHNVDLRKQGPPQKKGSSFASALRGVLRPPKERK